MGALVTVVGVAVVETVVMGAGAKGKKLVVYLCVYFIQNLSHVPVLLTTHEATNIYCLKLVISRC